MLGLGLAFALGLVLELRTSWTGTNLFEYLGLAQAWEKFSRPGDISLPLAIPIRVPSRGWRPIHRPTGLRWPAIAVAEMNTERLDRAPVGHGVLELVRNWVKTRWMDCIIADCLIEEYNRPLTATVAVHRRASAISCRNPNFRKKWKFRVKRFKRKRRHESLSPSFLHISEKLEKIIGVSPSPLFSKHRRRQSSLSLFLSKFYRTMRHGRLSKSCGFIFTNL